MVAQQLHAEVVDRGLVAGEIRRPAPVGHRLDDGGVEPFTLRDRRMHVPLVVLRPVARGQQDDELAQARRQGAAEADVVADVAGAVHHLGAAEQHHERPAEAVGVAGRLELLDGGLLLRGHLVLRQRRHAVLGCCGHGVCQGQQYGDDERAAGDARKLTSMVHVHGCVLTPGPRPVRRRGGAHPAPSGAGRSDSTT